MSSANFKLNRGSARKKTDEGYLRLEDVRDEDMLLPSFFPAFVLKLKQSLFAKKAPAAKTANKKVAKAIVRAEEYMHSAEFWLAGTFGIVVRLATKGTIASAIDPSQRLHAAALGVLACASAGLLAGMLVHWVRMRYHNALHPYARKQFFTKVLAEMALTGLLCGIVGGGIANVGAMLMDASTFVIGAVAGGAIGVLNAASKGIKAQGHKRGYGWRLALQGIAFGAVGGLLGGVSYDIVGADVSIAAPITQTDGVMYVPPSASYVCGAECANIIVPVQVQPVRTVPVAEPKAPVVVEPVKEPVKQVRKKVRARTSCNAPKPRKVVHRKKTVVKAKPVIVEKQVIVEKPVYMPAPPPPPQVTYQVYQSPCAMEACDFPYGGAPTIVAPTQIVPQGTPVQFAPAAAPMAPVHYAPAAAPATQAPPAYSAPAYMQQAPAYQQPAPAYAPAQQPIQLVPQQQMPSYQMPTQPYQMGPTHSVPIVPMQNQYMQNPVMMPQQMSNLELPNIKGPCKTADCVMQVNFNASGEATNAVLRPSDSLKSDFASASKGTTQAKTDRPYYMKASEVQKAPEAKVASVSDDAKEAAKSILLPFNAQVGGPGLTGPALISA